MGIELAKIADRGGDGAESRAFSCRDVDVALDHALLGADVRGCLVGERDDLLRAAAQVEALLGQAHAVPAAFEQRAAQLALEVGDLAGEGRLRHMQGLGGARHGTLLAHGEVVAEHADVHGTPFRAVWRCVRLSLCLVCIRQTVYSNCTEWSDGGRRHVSQWCCRGDSPTAVPSQRQPRKGATVSAVTNGADIVDRRPCRVRLMEGLCMYCGNCGQVNVDGAERCARCGAPLIGPRPQSQPAPRQTYPPQRPAQPTPQPPKSYAQTSQPPQPYAQTPQTQSTAWVPVQLSGSQNGWQQHGVAPAQQPPIQPMPGPVAPSAEGRPRPFLVAGLIALAIVILGFLFL